MARRRIEGVELVECPACNGTKKRDGDVCRFCEGEGQVSDDDHNTWVSESDCCSVCGGRGWLTGYDEPQQCDACGGYGA